MVSEQGGQSGRDSDLRAELSLRPERPPVMRLSRKVLMGLAAIAAITVSGALIWALYQGRDRPGAGGELYNTENKTTPDGLSTLPRDYTGVPRTAPLLGPPLPGDLGRPILMRRFPRLVQERRPPIRSSSASLRKTKRRAPAICSPPPAQGSALRRRSRRLLLPTRGQRHQPDKRMRLQSIPSLFSTCRIASPPS